MNRNLTLIKSSGILHPVNSSSPFPSPLRGEGEVRGCSSDGLG